MAINLHDCEIEGVFFDRVEKKLTVSIHNPDNGLQSLMIFINVEEFLIKGFVKQNVILDFMKVDKLSNPDYLKYCKEALGIDKDESHQLDSKFIYYFEPSIGLELICLSEGYYIKEQE